MSSRAYSNLNSLLAITVYVALQLCECCFRDCIRQLQPDMKLRLGLAAIRAMAHFAYERLGIQLETQLVCSLELREATAVLEQQT